MKLNELQNHLAQFFKNTEIQDSPRVWQDLMGFVLNLSWSELQLKKDSDVASADVEKILQWAEEIKEGKPLAHLTKEQFFYRDSFFIDERALIPRPETEIIVEKALEILPSSGSFVDLGTGSGCIGLSIAKYCPNSFGLLLDVSDEALEVCKINHQRLGVRNVSLQCREILSKTSVVGVENEGDSGGQTRSA